MKHIIVMDNFLNLEFFGVSFRWLIVFLIKGILIYLIVRIITALIKYLFRRSQRRRGRIVVDETKVGFVRQIAVVCVYVIGTAAFLSLIPGMEKVSNSILASAGIMAMAVGLASQEALSNIIGGLFIIFSRPFKVGDFIQVDEVIVGTVVEITLRHTVIRNIENRMILVPNNKINSSTIVNSSYGDTSTCALVEVGVSYNTELDRAISVMRDVVMSHPMLIDIRSNEDVSAGVPKVVIRVVNLGD